MFGWLLFGDELPNDWGNIGTAMLSLFVILTLEDFPRYMFRAMEVHQWAWVYFVSFVERGGVHRRERPDRNRSSTRWRTEHALAELEHELTSHGPDRLSSVTRAALCTRWASGR